MSLLFFLSTASITTRVWLALDPQSRVRHIRRLLWRYSFVVSDLAASFASLLMRFRPL